MDKVTRFSNESEWIDLLRQGDEGAFRYLIEQYQSRVFNTIVIIIQHHEDAEDLTQEVFLKIHASIGQFRGDAALSTWIYKLSVNMALDWERKKKTQKTISYFKNLIGLHTIQENLPDFNHPGVLLQHKETMYQLFKALKTLPADQKIVFVLMKLEERSSKETAEIMGKSIKSIEGLFQRAKKNLQVSITSIQ